MDRNEAERILARAAVRAEREHGIPAELVFAMAALESRWLQNAIGNNCFGIKYSPRRHSGKQLLRTTEWLLPEDKEVWLRRSPGRAILAEIAGPDARGRMLYSVRDWFAAYDSLDDCIEDYASLIARSQRYGPAIERYRQHGSLIDLARDLVRAGYSTTDPDQYAREIQRILGERQLAAIRAVRQEGGDVVA